MDSRYILYARMNCPFCKKAVELLKSKGEDYKVLNLKSRPKVLEELKKIYEWSTVPMVFHKQGNNIELVGGYTDLCKRLADG